MILKLQTQEENSRKKIIGFKNYLFFFPLMSKYAITVKSKDGKTCYLGPRGDGGQSYVIKEGLLGAALWNSYEEALMMKDLTVGDSGSVRSVSMANVKSTIVSREEMNALEKKANC